jgi:hypothetical protein
VAVLPGHIHGSCHSFVQRGRAHSSNHSIDDSVATSNSGNRTGTSRPFHHRRRNQHIRTNRTAHSDRGSKDDHTHVGYGNSDRHRHSHRYDCPCTNNSPNGP